MASLQTSAARYAVYFAPPPGSLLSERGASWLGRDAHVGSTLPFTRPVLADDLVADARRYGFHATLKPPFRLKDGRTEAALAAAIGHLASSLDSLTVPALALKEIDGFLALVPASLCPALDQLAALCVRDLDGFRRPASEEEIQRRRKSGLTKRQDGHLLRWGYPFVMEDFRFHMTLTCRLGSEEMRHAVSHANRHFQEVLGQPLLVDALTLFREAGPGHDFTVVQRFALRTTAERKAS